MPISVNCTCGKKLTAREEDLGRPWQCPACGQVLDIGLLRSAALLGSLTALPPPPPVKEASIVPAPSPLPDPPQPFEFTDADTGEPRRPLYRLSSPGTAAFAALLGGLIGGCLVLAKNYRSLGKKTPARLLILAGLVGTLALFWILWRFARPPARLPGLVYLGRLFVLQLAGSAVAIFAAARLLQQRACALHRKRGGRMTPARAAVPPSLILSAAIFIFQVIATYPVTWDGTGGGLVFGPGEELLYTEGVSRDLAEKLGDKLHEIGLFNGDGAHRSIIVSRVNDIFQVRIFLRHGVWKQRAFADFARDLRDRLEREVFAGAPVEIVLCDEFNRPQRWITRAPLEQME